MISNSLSVFLKEKTNDLHGKVEKHLNSSLLLSDDLSKVAYYEHLQKLEKGHCMLDMALIEYKNQQELKPFLPTENYIALLQDEMKQFENYQKNTNTEDRKPLNIDSWEMALGALYVLNGSTLGRRFIAKKIESKLIAWNLYSKFYNSQILKSINWPKYKTDLDELGRTTNVQEKALEGAYLAFKVFLSV